MRAVIQRVTSGRVTISDELVGSIASGLVVFLGVATGDTERDVEYLVDKIIHLRCFADQQEKMNRSLVDRVNAGEPAGLLVVSQFTLVGDCRRGRRPSFIDAAPPALAEALYQRFVDHARALGCHVETGRFRQDMQVNLVNDGPVTLLLDSTRTF